MSKSFQVVTGFICLSFFSYLTSQFLAIFGTVKSADITLGLAMVGVTLITGVATGLFLIVRTDFLQE